MPCHGTCACPCDRGCCSGVAAAHAITYGFGPWRVRRRVHTSSITCCSNTWRLQSSTSQALVVTAPNIVYMWLLHPATTAAARPAAACWCVAACCRCKRMCWRLGEEVMAQPPGTELGRALQLHACCVVNVGDPKARCKTCIINKWPSARTHISGRGGVVVPAKQCWTLGGISCCAQA